MNANKIFLKSITSIDQKVAQLSNNRIHVSFTDTCFASILTISECYFDDLEPVIGLGMSLCENPAVRLLIAMTDKSHKAIAYAIFGHQGISSSEMTHSIFQEMGNIIGTSIANDLSIILQQPIKTTIPEIRQDLAGALLNTVIGSINSFDDNLLRLDLELEVENIKSECKLLLLMDHQAEAVINHYS